MKARRILSGALVVAVMAFAIPAQAGHCMKQNHKCCTKACRKVAHKCCQKGGGGKYCTHKDDCCGKKCGTADSY